MSNKISSITRENKKAHEFNINNIRLQRTIDNHNRILVVSALIITMCFTIIIPQINRKSANPLLKHSTLRYKLLKIGFILIFLVTMINIIVIIMIFGHLFNMSNQATNLKLNKNWISIKDSKKNLINAVKYHTRRKSWISFSRFLFKLSIILLIIGLGIVLLARHHGLNLFEQIIIIITCLLSVIFSIYYLVKIQGINYNLF